MASVNSDFDVPIDTPLPRIRKIGINDLQDALRLGFEDFKAMPTYSVFLIFIYPVVGLLLLWITFGYNLIYLTFPLVAGFALLGPIAAIGLYELSRRREQGLPFSWAALNVFTLLRVRSIALLALVLMALFLLWEATALALYETTFGGWNPPSLGAFVRAILTTDAGWQLILIGCGVGFFFAAVTFVISVVSFPLLVDRDVGAAMAIATSAKACAANPFTMAVWALIIAASLLIGSLPAFIGLAVVLPILGHSTWHLYRKVVVQ
ncbi:MULTISPECIES: DUF2189 domain-containing protein [Rhodomicrobium]|uniref:DUF2189 domain-containing protein n=1 Tax=Rhodomicrobium TaxID=1068 RepID=UPI000B4C05C9|nr:MULTISPECIES: DUF2189 domain-containing protein [Rhodomicrobium]